MKDFKNIFISIKNKFKVITKRDLKFSLNTDSIKSSKFYKNSESKIKTLSKFLKDKITFHRKKKYK